MATPAWTAQYNFGNTPEQNGFTRIVSDAATLVLTQSGPTAGRKLTVNCTNADDSVVLVTSTVPSLSESIGATAEAIVAVSGATLGIYPPDAGFELDFLNHNIQILVQQTAIVVSLGDDALAANQNTTVPTADNSTATTIRLTVDNAGNVRVYRNTVLIFGPVAWPVAVSPFQRVLFWGENGGPSSMVFTEMAYYLGGAVAP